VQRGEQGVYKRGEKKKKNSEHVQTIERACLALFIAEGNKKIEKLKVFMVVMKEKYLFEKFWGRREGHIHGPLDNPNLDGALLLGGKSINTIERRTEGVN